MSSCYLASFIYEEVKIKITEVLEACNNLPERLLICLNGTNDFTISITRKQAEELCEKLEKALYDEPTYKELDRQCDALIVENEKLRNELDYYREQKEEQEAFERSRMCR